MANYLYIFRGGDMARKSPAELAQSMKKWAAWMADLSAKGLLKGGDPLANEGRVLSGRTKAVTDGPYAESKDIVGGYLLVTTRDLDHATEAARGCPIFDNEEGSVEIREVRQMSM
jgi:hypothetical protein